MGVEPEEGGTGDGSWVDGRKIRPAKRDVTLSKIRAAIRAAIWTWGHLGNQGDWWTGAFQKNSQGFGVGGLLVGRRPIKRQGPPYIEKGKGKKSTPRSRETLSGGAPPTTKSTQGGVHDSGEKPHWDLAERNRRCTRLRRTIERNSRRQARKKSQGSEGRGGCRGMIR